MNGGKLYCTEIENMFVCSIIFVRATLHHGTGQLFMGITNLD